MSDTKTYEIARGDSTGRAWFQGQLRKVGEKIELTPDQAKYGIMDGLLVESGRVVAKPVETAPEPAPVEPEEPIEVSSFDDVVEVEASDSDEGSEDESEDEPKKGRRKRK